MTDTGGGWARKPDVGVWNVSRYEANSHGGATDGLQEKPTYCSCVDYDVCG